MAGEILQVGDLTCCGGKIVTGDASFILHGVSAAREGDKHTCGKDGKLYNIIGGAPDIFSESRRLAGTLDSITGCPCRTRFIKVITGNYFYGPHTDNSAGSSASHNSPKTDRVIYVQQAKKKPEPLPLPSRIFETINQMDDYNAPDMQYGDLTEEELKARGLTDVAITCEDLSVLKMMGRAQHPVSSKDALPICNPYTMPDRAESARIMFDRFRGMSDTASFVGEYQGLMRKMITHMQGNTGAPFSDPLLDKAMLERILSDETKNSSLKAIKEVLQDNIIWDEGYYPLSMKGEFNERIQDRILPKFNDLKDRINGLGITVHDTWSTHITLQSLEVNGDNFRATVHYRIQDHFGLDDADIGNNFYRTFGLFRIWFILQRWHEYGYKPFITEMNATVVIEGEQIGED